MIGYQLGAALREIVALRLRAVLLLLQVVVVAVTLAGTLHDTLRSLSDLAVARRFAGPVSYFTIYYDDMERGEFTEEMTRELISTFDGSSADYSIVKNNYFEAQHISVPVLVALGGFAQAYQLPLSQDNVVIGAGVTAYDVGDVITLGTRQFTIASRLPPQTAYLDPWMGYESLDEVMLLLSSYERFAAMTEPGYWQEELVGRAVLFNPTKSEIEAYVAAADSAGSINIVPRELGQRISSVYEKGLAQSSMFLVFFGSLMLVVIGTTMATVDALLVANLRRYQIEMLYGAHQGHVVMRINLFLLLIMSLPILAIFAAISLISPVLRPVLSTLPILLLLIHGVLSVRALWGLNRASVTALLRKE